MALTPEEEARLRVVENAIYANAHAIARLERDVSALDQVPERLARIDAKLDALGEGKVNWQSWLLALSGWAVALLGWLINSP